MFEQRDERAAVVARHVAELVKAERQHQVCVEPLVEPVLGAPAALVGAAARQTKPTTGGGLYFGVRAARMAAASTLRGTVL